MRVTPEEVQERINTLVEWGVKLCKESAAWARRRDFAALAEATCRSHGVKRICDLPAESLDALEQAAREMLEGGEEA